CQRQGHVRVVVGYEGRLVLNAGLVERAGLGQLLALVAQLVAPLQHRRAAAEGRPADLHRVSAQTEGGVYDHVKAGELGHEMLLTSESASIAVDHPRRRRQMPLLEVHDFWDVLVDPAWIMFFLTM